MKNNLLIIIPIKKLENVKSRLSEMLTLEDRITLTNFLLNELINKLINIKINNKFIKIEIAIVTQNKIIESFANRNKIKIINDFGTNSLSGSIKHASEWALENQFKSLCIILGDLANPEIRDIVQFINPPFLANEMRICPSYDYGTNALFVSPPNAIKFSYGRKSFYKHYISAIKSKLKISILPMKSIRNDIDNSKNLTEFLSKEKHLQFFDQNHLKILSK